MFHRGWALAACGLLLIISAGCGSSGPALYNVSGTVTYEGKPVEGASILFTPQQGRPSMGATDASGKYTISTNGKPGVGAGTYTVTITKQGGASGGEASAADMPPAAEHLTEEEMAKMQQNMIDKMRNASKERGKIKPALPEKYSNPQNSGLTATVTTDAAKNIFDFQLQP